MLINKNESNYIMVKAGSNRVFITNNPVNNFNKFQSVEVFGSLKTYLIEKLDLKSWSEENEV